MRRAFACLALVALAGTAAHATTSTTRRLEYREVGGDGPRLIVKGEGCLQAEDSTTLRLVDYRGDGQPGAEGDTLVYRCIAP